MTYETFTHRPSWSGPALRDRRGFTYRAFLPRPVGGFDPGLRTDTLERVEAAAVALARAPASVPVAWEPTARLLLRTEGAGSSAIEGIVVSYRRLFEATLHGGDERAGWALAAIRATESALAAADVDLSGAEILRWHRELMGHDPAARPGRLRQEQNWIGGRTLQQAEFVPPHPRHLPTLMDDLVVLSNRDDLPAVALAAIAHAQFETIHPFLDGNGRVGRILALWILKRRGVTGDVTPPLSLVLAAHADRYIEGLIAYRTGEVDRWVWQFAEACLAAAGQVAAVGSAVRGLLDAWHGQLQGRVRRTAAAHTLVDCLPGQPVMTVKHAAALAGVSVPAARAALQSLAEVGILVEGKLPRRGRGRPEAAWVAEGVFELLEKMRP